MSERSIDEMGPVDYLVVEFPSGQANFTGEIAQELVRLVDAGAIRLIDVVILTKDAEGEIDAIEIEDLGELGPLVELESELAELLAAEHLVNLAVAMEPGAVAGVLVYENLWAASFASAVRRAGGRLIADGRIPTQAILGSFEDDASVDTEEE